MEQIYADRLAALNQRQRQAVDQIDGPLLVLAGPGTGKTELLSMRTARILDKTDTLPSSILCLTFTESGAIAMRERLRSIIGADAYKVAIHTFHGFGTEIINQNREYFYHGAEYRPADELKQYEILHSIFSDLDYTNPLAGSNGEDYTYLDDARTVIAELKRSGLTSEELRKIIDANEQVLDDLERELSDIFASRISAKTVEQLSSIAHQAANIDQPALPAGITPLANTIALSVAHAVDEAADSGSTKPVTAWKNQWCEKDDQGRVVFKDRKRHTKLRALAHVYSEYIRRMDQAGLYDYDDMILQVVHALETQADLRANIQERYLYIMVDEFQDTSLAQLRLLFTIAPNSDDNVMAVGDDDQAIYSFQGADISNIHSFRRHFDNPPVVVLTDNYRSTTTILKHARAVITQSNNRLEQSMDGLSKQLVAHRDDQPTVSLSEYASVSDERHAIALAIRSQLDDGVAPESIAVLGRRHHELVALLPYLSQQGISVNYERRDDALTHPVVNIVESILHIVNDLHHNAHDKADARLPQLLAHPAFAYRPADIYRLSLASHRNHQRWLETMQTMPVFTPIANWLLQLSQDSYHQPLEQLIDIILGHDIERPLDSADESTSFVSPLASYFFSPDKLASQPDAYLASLEALRTIRDRVAEHSGRQAPTVELFLEFVTMHRQLNSPIMISRQRSSHAAGRINLMTAHKSKGLEFDHVYIHGAVDSMWGERVRSRSRLISYPANLPLAPAGDNYDERLRLFYVAMTRARHSLAISYSTETSDGKPLLAASFLADSQLTADGQKSDKAIDQLITQIEIDWRDRLSHPIDSDMHDLLQPVLERYKLSATHLGNFLDVSRGGPQHFLMTNLLRFPQAKSANAHYGTAIHTTLQRAHDHLRATGQRRPLEDILGDYERLLREQHVSEDEIDKLLSRGIDALSAFLDTAYDSFTTSQRTELGFGAQEVVVGEARLTGALDLVDIDDGDKTIRVTDYKTGAPSRDWRGRSEYQKMKLHRYRQQLMFYQLLVENSRDYGNYSFIGGVLQFVEPSNNGEILALEANFSREDIDHFRQLISAVWQSITTLELPDISDYPPTLKGIERFEQDLIDRYGDS